MSLFDGGGDDAGDRRSSSGSRRMSLKKKRGFMDSYVVEYVADLRCYDALNALLADRRVKEARPFSDRIEARVTLVSLERTLAQNEELLANGMFAPEEHSEVEEEEESRDDDMEEEEGEDEDYLGRRREGRKPRPKKNSEAQMAWLKDIQEFWTFVAKALLDLEPVRPLDVGTLVPLKLAQLFIELRLDEDLPDLDEFSAQEVKHLTKVIKKFFDPKEEVNTGSDELDEAIAVLLADQCPKVHRARAAYEQLLVHSRKFSYPRVIKNIRSYLNAVRKDLGKPALARVEDILKSDERGDGSLHDGGRPAAAAAAAAAAASGGRDSDTIQRLQARRESLARIVKDPLPGALETPKRKSTLSMGVESVHSDSGERHSDSDIDDVALTQPMTPLSRSGTSSSLKMSKHVQHQQQEEEEEEEEKRDDQMKTGKKRNSQPISAPEKADGGKKVPMDEDLLEFVNSTEPPVKKSKQRRPFSEEEVKNLKLGVARFGAGNWRMIRMTYKFDDRSTVDLKDKWRNLQKVERRAQKRVIEDIAANGLHDSPQDSDNE